MRIATLVVCCMFGAQSDTATLVAKYMELSGARAQLEQLPATMIAQFKQMQISGDAAARQIVLPAMERAFQEKSYRETIEARLVELVQAADVSRVLEFYGSDLSRKLSAAEVDAGKPESMKEMTAFSQSLSVTPPRPERVQLLSRMQAALRLTESSVEQALVMQEALLLGANSALPKDRQRLPEEISARVAAGRKSVEAQPSTVLMMSLLFTYRNLTEQDLQDYLRVIESEPHRRLVEAFAQASRETLRGFARRVGVLMATPTASVPSFERSPDWSGRGRTAVPGCLLVGVAETE